MHLIYIYKWIDVSEYKDIHGQYNRNKDYYLVISDEETGIELSRVKFVIDIAISNNFNF